MSRTHGKTIPGLYADLIAQNHLLIAGCTGSGKSVVINGMVSAIQAVKPGSKLVLIDPKRVELVQYKRSRQTVIYAADKESIYKALETAVEITEKRYKYMQLFRQKLYKGNDLYIFIDEFADLMTTDKKRCKSLVQRLAQIGRAARVHVVLATQTPISAIIPTEIKCNFDSRLALRCRSAQDSRNILGLKGAEMLPRYGQGIYMTAAEFAKVNIPKITK